MQVILLWNSTNVVGKVFYVVFTCLMMPAYLFMRIFWDMSAPFISQPQRRSSETSFVSSFTRSTRFQRPAHNSSFTLFLTYFTFPLNRCITSIYFNFIFCVLLIASSVSEESEEVQADQTGTKNKGERINSSRYLRFVVMVLSFSYLVRLVGFLG